MAENILLINLCKGFKVAKKIALAAPLDDVNLQGIASAGRQPLIAHRKTPGKAILSRVRMESGDYAGARFTIGDGSDASSLAYPAYSPVIAGLQGENPITATETDPFPLASGLTYEILHAIDGDIIAWRSSDPFFVPGSYLPEPSTPMFNVNVPYYLRRFGATERDSQVAGSLSLRPYQTFQLMTRVNYTPNGEPLACNYYDNHDVNPSAYPAGQVPGYFWPDLSNNANHEFFDGRNEEDVTSRDLSNHILAGSACNFFGHLWEVVPAFVAKPGDETLTGTAWKKNGTAFPHRGASFVRHEVATMPGFGESISRSFNVTGARPSIVIYATEHVDGIALNGVPGQLFSGSAPTSRSFQASGIFANELAYPRAFFWTGFLSTVSLHMEVTAFGHTINDTVTTGGPDRYVSVAGPGHHYWEGLCIATKSFYSGGVVTSTIM